MSCAATISDPILKSWSKRHMNGSELRHLSDDDEEDEDAQLSQNQTRLLYLISLYSKAAVQATDAEDWIPKSALHVLLYEAIITKALDYDYAPSSELIDNKRHYINTSHEGTSDLDYLCENGLLHNLKLCANNSEPITCYQISKKGTGRLDQIDTIDKLFVDKVVHAPGTSRLLTVEWKDEIFSLVDALHKYCRESSITDIEDVSYVSSAYIPQHFRHRGRPTLSNAHRAYECAIGASTIKDELDEVIALGSASISVAEYVPFGSNQMVQLNITLGSNERIQGGFFTASTDTKVSHTHVAVRPGLTSITVLDYQTSSHVNFEADIHFPEAPGILQIEAFGCSILATGSCFYGMQIEAIMNHVRDHISLDHLSRLLVDVHMDSSTILQSILSDHQRGLMQFIYSDDSLSRNKMNLIIANQIKPHLSARDYMDRGELENEFKQIIGHVRAAYDITDHDTLILGSNGLLMAGPKCRVYEPLLCCCVQFEAINLFIQVFFGRASAFIQELKSMQTEVMENVIKDPQSSDTVWHRSVKFSHEIILLEEVPVYLKESLEGMRIPLEPPDQAGRSLYERLELGVSKERLELRVQDLEKAAIQSRKELDNVEKLSILRAEKRSQQEKKVARMQSRQPMDSSRNIEVATSLRALQALMSGLLAFGLLDRFTGDWTVMDTKWMEAFVSTMLLNNPGLWFVISIITWGSIVGCIVVLFRRVSYRSKGIIRISMEERMPIHLSNLRKYIHSKPIDYETKKCADSVQLTKICWKEADKAEWGGGLPEIELEFDETKGFLHRIGISYNQRQATRALAFSSDELSKRMIQQLNEAKVLIS
uniref:Uncharacterized protein AlNc14C1053G12742 n=1 Tax=Albugo laibachii Nc14 TaxID=890382 RepID=F0X2G7_9STRA|nr:conserved unknown protein putative [Albugo laibachii Nc14]|eukprot:CCA28064.1 conserved unknown protein putative [Albugo laibachii Nc14]